MGIGERCFVCSLYRTLREGQNVSSKDYNLWKTENLRRIIEVPITYRSCAAWLRFEHHPLELEVLARMLIVNLSYDMPHHQSAYSQSGTIMNIHAWYRKSKYYTYPITILCSGVSHDCCICVIPYVEEFQFTYSMSSNCLNEYKKAVYHWGYTILKHTRRKNQLLPRHWSFLGVSTSIGWSKRGGWKTVEILTPVRIFIVFPTRPISDLRFHTPKKA